MASYFHAGQYEIACARARYDRVETALRALDDDGFGALASELRTSMWDEHIAPLLRVASFDGVLAAWPGLEALASLTGAAAACLRVGYYECAAAAGPLAPGQVED